MKSDKYARKMLKGIKKGKAARAMLRGMNSFAKKVSKNI